MPFHWPSACLSCTKLWLQPGAQNKQDMVAMTTKVRTQEVEAGGLVVQGYSLLHSDDKATWNT